MGPESNSPRSDRSGNLPSRIVVQDRPRCPRCSLSAFLHPDLSKQKGAKVTARGNSQAVLGSGLDGHGRQDRMHCLTAAWIRKSSKGTARLLELITAPTPSSNKSIPSSAIPSLSGDVSAKRSTATFCAWPSERKI